MWLTSFLDSLRSRSAKSRRGRSRRRPGRRNPAGSSLRLELLEDRNLLSFTPALIYPVEQNPQAVAAADLNGDGRLDLVVANNYSNTVSVLTGNADGTFNPAQSFATGAGPRSLAVGDFNGDGKLDIVTANAGDLSLLQNAGNDVNGNPTFQAAQSLNIGSNPLSVAVGDVNADGKLDVVATSYIYYGGGGGGGYCCYDPHGYTVDPVNVLLGTGADSNGNATFSAPTTYALASSNAAAVAVADVNGDGQPDVVTANNDISTVSVLLNTVDSNGLGTGALQTPIDFAVGSGPLSVAVGDFNADGRPDVVTANNYSNTVSVLLGSGLDAAGSLTFQPAQDFAVGASPTGVAVGDFNGDGKADIVATTGEGVTVLLGDGLGGFLTPDHALVGTGPRAVAVGNFNGDGATDLAVADASSADVAVLTNTKSWPSAGAPSISISDVTITEGNDGTASAVFTVTLSAAYGQDVTVHYSTADGTASAGSDYTATSGTLTIGAGQPSQTFSVAITGDRIAEPNETFLVNLSQATGAFTADPQAVGTIVDDEPTISIDGMTKQEGNHGTTLFFFTVSLSAAYDQPVTVNYGTADGTATVADHDYQATSGTLQFAAGQTTATITVVVYGDKKVEGDEYFLVNLSGASSNAQIAVGQGYGLILTDDVRGRHR